MQDLRLQATLPWLVADIGGTNARFGWVDDPATGIRHVATLPVAGHVGPASAARAYMAAIGATAAPRRAALAVATPVQSDVVELTNSHWRFSRTALASDLGLDALLVLNDFEALALSLPRLGAAQLRPIGDAQALPQGDAAAATRAPARGTLAVVGPGTGLGVGGVVETTRGWLALPGEGGHVTLAPADDFESQLLAAARRHHAHVSAERLLSGIGLPVLHAAVADVLGQPLEPLPSEAIVERGVAGSDAVCRHTVDTFCALLGGFAGNVALTLGARGGVYIGGGIVPRLGELFFASGFRERFEAKGRFRGYLEAVPTCLITDTLAALSGAALALEQHA